MLVFDGLLIAFSPFLLHDHFHFSFGVFDYGSLYFDVVARNEWVTPKGVFTRPNLVYVAEVEYVTRTHIFEVGNGEDVAWS